MACLECRRRRIKCDNIRPRCCQCTRQSKNCKYAEVEHQQVPKKRVRELEERLALVEARLNNGVLPSPADPFSGTLGSAGSDASLFHDEWTPTTTGLMSLVPSINIPEFSVPLGLPSYSAESMVWSNLSNEITKVPPIDDELQTMLPNVMDSFPSLQEIQDLTKIYRDTVYPCVPILHPDRHDTTQLSSEIQDPLCLRYAMWAHAAARSTQYTKRASGFYKNARIHLEHDEMQDDGLGLVSIAHVQACLLIAIYETDIGTPARAFMSSRRAIALSSMIGLQAQDSGESWATFKILKPAKDPIEAEERRRTFWYLFFADKWASSSSGKSSSITESEITTLLPCSESAFCNGLVDSQQTLRDAITNGASGATSPLTIAVLSGCLLSGITAHLRELQEDVKKQRGNMPEFWMRHQQLVNDTTSLIARVSKDGPAHNTTDPFTLFLNMCLHGYLITLCQTAATFANEHSESVELGARLRYRARQAAEEVVGAMQVASRLDIRKLFPTTPSCLYLASSVFILDLKAGHNVEHARERLQYILHSIRQFNKVWKFSQLFLEQLLHNLEDYDIEIGEVQADRNPMKCLEGMGRWSAMGPLFVADPALKTEPS